MVAKAVLEGEDPELAAAASPEPWSRSRLAAAAAECQLRARVTCVGGFWSCWVLSASFRGTLGIVEPWQKEGDSSTKQLAGYDPSEIKIVSTDHFKVALI